MSHELLEAARALKVGDECFALDDDGIMYKAKVIRIDEAADGGDKFFSIHYLGWHKRHDESVTAEFLFPCNEAGSAAAAASNAEAKAIADAAKSSESSNKKRSAEIDDHSIEESEEEPQQQNPELSMAFSFMYDENVKIDHRFTDDEFYELVNCQPQSMVPFMERCFTMRDGGGNMYAAHHKCLCEASVVGAPTMYELFYYVDVFARGDEVRLSLPICENASVAKKNDYAAARQCARHLLESFRAKSHDSIAIKELSLPQVPTSVVIFLLNPELKRSHGVVVYKIPLH